MNIKNYQKFEELINYIESNLCEEINFKKLALILNVNEYTMHRIFLFVTNMTLSEYIRKRRLSQASLDLINGNEKIIDIAVKYGYESSVSFSRAYKKMMGFVPSQSLDNKNCIKFYPKFEILNSENIDELNYKIEKDLNFNLYGIYFKTTIENCHNEAPLFWKENKNLFISKKEYGLLEYDKKCLKNQAKYYIATDEKVKNLKLIKIPKCNYLIFTLKYENSTKLYETIKLIYSMILPSLNFDLVNIPDIEEYLEENMLNLYIPIKDKQI